MQQTPGQAAALTTAKEQAKAGALVPTGPTQPPPAPGMLPSTLDEKAFFDNHPGMDADSARKVFVSEQGKYKNEVKDIRGIESAKQSALKISDKIVKFMDDEGLTGGGLGRNGKGQSVR